MSGSSMRRPEPCPLGTKPQWLADRRNSGRARMRTFEQRHEAELPLVQKRRDLDDVRRKLTGLIEAIADGLRAPGSQSRLDELERPLAAELEAAPPPAPRLHPPLVSRHHDAFGRGEAIHPK